MNNKEKLLKYSIYYLSKYSSSKKNLEFVLKKKIRRLSDDKKIRYELYNEITTILKKLESLNLLNDKLFTESKIRFLLNQAKSQNYIKLYLVRKGVDIKLIDKEISQIYNSDKNIEKNNALKFAKKKNLLKNNLDFEKSLSKMARAGFSYETAKEVLK